MPTVITQEFRFAALAVDVVVFTLIKDTLHVLLTRNIKEPFKGIRSLPGGLVKESESLEMTVKRVLAPIIDGTGMYMEQLYTFGNVERDPRSRVVSVAYLALIPSDAIHLFPSTYDIDWIPVNNLPALAYDHTEIIGTAVTRLKGKLSYTNIIFALMPEEFTLTKLQQTYECILGHSIDKRNFRKKILQLDLVEESGNTVKGEPNRPAQLYRFKKREMIEIEML
jgi:8-oxo-dGTP diphosphatase